MILILASTVHSSLPTQPSEKDSLNLRWQAAICVAALQISRYPTQTHTQGLAFVSEFYVATPVRATQREQLYTTRATQ